MEGIKSKLQQAMAVRFDAEFAQISDLIEQAYYQGLEEGRESAKTEIINLIKDGK